MELNALYTNIVLMKLDGNYKLHATELWGDLFHNVWKWTYIEPSTLELVNQV